MPNNLGVSTGKTRVEKRHFNETLFGTKKISGIFNSVPKVIKDNLTKKPVKHKDFDSIALNIISKLYIGDNSDKSIDKLVVESIFSSSGDSIVENN